MDYTTAYLIQAEALITRALNNLDEIIPEVDTVQAAELMSVRQDLQSARFALTNLRSLMQPGTKWVVSSSDNTLLPSQR